MIPGVNIISIKASVVSIIEAGVSGWGGGCSAPLNGSFRGVLGSKEHLDWLKEDLNANKLTLVQDYKHRKN